MALQSKANLYHLNGLLLVSSVSWSLVPVFNFSSINVCFYTIPPPVFWSSSSSTGIIIKFLTHCSFTIYSVNITNPFQRFIVINETIPASPNSIINSVLHPFLQFSFTLIPIQIRLRTFLLETASSLVRSLFNVQIILRWSYQCL